MSLHQLFAAAILLTNDRGEFLNFCCSGARADGAVFAAEQVERLTRENPGYRAISQVVIRVSDDAVTRAGFVPVFNPPSQAAAEGP